MVLEVPYEFDNIHKSSIPEGPEKDGYSFVGWNTKEDASGEYITTDTVINKGESIVCYPIYGTYFAVYSATDNSFNFYSDVTVPAVGDTYKDKVVTKLYTGFGFEEYSGSSTKTTVPWSDIVDLVKTVTVDSSFAFIKPTYTAYWFFGFSNCESIDLKNLNTSEVLSMAGMFRDCTVKSLDVSGFETSKCKDFAQMFYLCSGVTSLDVGHFDTSNATEINAMFREMPNIVELDISNLDTSQTTAINAMFRDSPNLTTIYSNDFNTDKVTNDANMFLNCPLLTGGNGTTYDSSKVTSVMAFIDTADTPGYFTDPAELGGVSPKGYYTFAVYSDDDKSLTFYTDTSLPSAGSSYNSKAATEVYTGFEGASYDYSSSFPYSTAPWASRCADVTSIECNESFLRVKPVSMSYWFSHFSVLTNADFTNMDTSRVTSMAGAFTDCYRLTSIDTSSFDTSRVTDMREMFNDCYSLTSLDVSHFDTSNVTDMTYMFWNCSGITTIYSNDSNFVTTAVSRSTQMFYNCSSISGGRGTTYNADKVDASMAHIDSSSNPGYFTSK